MIKRILIFSLAYYPQASGAEIAIKEITDRLGDVEFDLVTMRFSLSDPAFEKIGNVNIYRLGAGAGYFDKMLFILRAAIKTAYLKKEKKYDLFWAMMTYMTMPISILRLAGDKTPFVITLQDGDPFEHVFNRWYIRPVKFLITAAFYNAKKIQVISSYLAGWAQKLRARGEVVVIPNGVNIKRFAHPAPSTQKVGDKITLVTTSRLVEKNAVEDIISALAYLPENVELKIAGTGILETTLRDQVKNLGLENRVVFLGNVSQAELPALLHSCDIFIRPSLSEGQGVSFMEAFAASLPVIATPVGGIPDFLKDGETGLFCEVKNPKSIALKVEKLMKDRESRDYIVANALTLVQEKYDWDLIAGEMQKRIFDSE